METPQYRLRIDEIRVFYDVVENAVEIIAVVHKTYAAEWLAREGIIAGETNTLQESEEHRTDEDN
jgi:hypothetical protein